MPPTVLTEREAQQLALLARVLARQRLADAKLTKVRLPASLLKDIDDHLRQSGIATP